MNRLRSNVLCVAVLATTSGGIGSQPAQSPLAPSTGAISGRITDESGRPVVGARVQAVGRLKRWGGLYYEVATASRDDSDDRGQFRLHSLPPGSYVVAVSMQSEKSTSPLETGYLRIYNPSTISLAEAQPVTVQAGQEQTVSIRTFLVRFTSVSGVATTSAGLPAENFDVWLRGGPAAVGYAGPVGGFTTPMVASTRVALDGSFTLWRVPAGAYTLAVTNGYTRRGRPFEIAEIPLDVADAPVTGIRVVTAPGAIVSGRLEWAGTGPVPWPRETKNLGSIRATAVGREIDFASSSTDVRPDGTFQFTDLYGLRRVEAVTLIFNWKVASVDGPQDVLAGPNLNFKPGTVVKDLRVFVTNRTAMLDATVADEEGKPFLTGSFLLMPRSPTERDPLGWGYNATQQNRGQDGVSYYSMDGILPGSYLAVAIDVEPYRLTGDSDLMERARAAAIPIEVHEGRMVLAVPLVRLRPFVRNSR